jgi:hypothetical protein
VDGAGPVHGVSETLIMYVIREPRWYSG